MLYGGGAKIYTKGYGGGAKSNGEDDDGDYEDGYEERTSFWAKPVFSSKCF